VKVGDLIQSSAFVGQNGIILEVDRIENSPENEIWLLIHWLSANEAYTSRRDRREWLRPWEIEPRDIS
jgi:hypothetical protein